MAKEIAKNYDDAEKCIRKATAWYVREFDRLIRENGGPAALAEKLDQTASNMSMARKDGSLTRMRRLVLKTYKVVGK